MSKLSLSYHWIVQPILVIGILLFGFIGAKGFSMFKEEPQTTERAVYAPLVKVLNTELTTEQVIIEGNGVLEARTRINLVPQVGGRVAYIHPNLRPGGSFEDNETLVEIERIDYELDVTRIEAEVAAAKTKLELEVAEADSARDEWLALHSDQAIPTLVGREPQIAEAKAQLDAAEARLAQAHLDLDRTRIKMPFDGRVVSATIDVGEVITANQQIGIVYNSERFEIPIPLEINRLAWIELPNAQQGTPGNPVKIFINIGEEELILSGEVIRIESELAELSRFARVIVSLKTDDIPEFIKEKVIPGLFVNVAIMSQELIEVTSLPDTALRQGNSIWIINDKNTLQIIEPDIIYRSGKNILVKNLAKDTQVVITNLDIVTDGMQVRTSDSPQ